MDLQKSGSGQNAGQPRSTAGLCGPEDAAAAAYVCVWGGGGAGARGMDERGVLHLVQLWCGLPRYQALCWLCCCLMGVGSGVCCVGGCAAVVCCVGASSIWCGRVLLRPQSVPARPGGPGRCLAPPASVLLLA